MISLPPMKLLKHGRSNETFSAANTKRFCGLHFWWPSLTSYRYQFYFILCPEILSRIGLGAKESLANSIAIGGTNLIFTFVGLYLIDRLGRKTLLIIGSIGYILSLAMVAYAFNTGASAPFIDDVSIIVHCFTCNRSGRCDLGIYCRNISQ